IAVLATPIGTPPNLIGLHFLQDGGYAQITFFHWTILGVPVVITLFLFLFAYMNFFCRAGVREIEGGREMPSRSYGTGSPRASLPSSERRSSSCCPARRGSAPSRGRRRRRSTGASSSSTAEASPWATSR